MSESEQAILISLKRNIGKMTEFEKGYILGMAESKSQEPEKPAGGNNGDDERTAGR